jgi:hypothetical protein
MRSEFAVFRQQFLKMLLYREIPERGRFKLFFSILCSFFFLF